MAIRHITKPDPRIDSNDIWRMSYCGSSVRVTQCVSLSMYMKNFFKLVQYRQSQGIPDKLTACEKCIENIDGLDLLNQIP